MDVPPTNSTSAHGDAIRVVLQQPALPKYRIPVFRELARRSGIDLRVIYGEIAGLPNVEPDGFNATFVPMRTLKLGPREVLWHWPQVRFADRAHTDVLILSWNLHYATLVPALLRARASGVKTILWGHGYSRAEASARSFLRNGVGKLADALLFYGHRTANRFIEAGWPRDRIFVAANSLDQTAIAAARQSWLGRPDDLQRFRHQSGVGQGPVCLFVSRLLPENRIDLLVAAAAKLKPKHPTMKIVLVGKGDQEPLREQARVLGVVDSVLFVGGVYDEEKIAPYFLSSDVFVYPAKLGLSIMHCFGYGVPIVTAESEETQFPEREALAPGVNGLTFRDDDAEDLARAIDEMLSDPERRRRMGEAALETIRREYSVARMVDGFEAAIRGVARSA